MGNEKIVTSIRLEGSTEKLRAKYGIMRTRCYMSVSIDGEIVYEESSPLSGTKKLAKIAASRKGVGVEFFYTTIRDHAALRIGEYNLSLDAGKSTPLRPTIQLTSFYSTREDHYKKVGKVKDMLVEEGWLPQQGSCQVTMTIDC